MARKKSEVPVSKAATSKKRGRKSKQSEVIEAKQAKSKAKKVATEKLKTKTARRTRKSKEPLNAHDALPCLEGALFYKYRSLLAEMQASLLAVRSHNMEISLAESEIVKARERVANMRSFLEQLKADAKRCEASYNECMLEISRNFNLDPKAITIDIETGVIMQPVTAAMMAQKSKS